jgi:probable rRNA maturation factor
MKIKLDVLIEEELWTHHTFASKLYIKRIITATLDALNWIMPPSKIQACVLLTHNEQMQNLNHSFLGIPQSTNVLAFPNENHNYKSLLSSCPITLDLGDIALGYQTLQAESSKYNLTFKDHFTHLLMHATLHTLGFDHQNKKDSAEMYTIEDKLLAKLKIKRCIRSANHCEESEG